MALGVSAAALAVGAGLFGIVKETANAGDEAVKTSQKIGISIKSFQRLSHAAKLADLSQEQLASGLKLFSRNLVDAAEGGKETGKTFRKLKIDPKKMVGKTEETLIAIADQFAAMPDGAKKTALAMDLFGRSGAEMIPFLNAGGKAIKQLGDEAEMFGAVIDDVTAKQGEEFNDQITRMGVLFKGLRTIVGSALLPVFKDAIDASLEWFKANRNLIQSKVKDWAIQIRDAVKSFAGWVQKVAPVIQDWVTKLGGIEGVASKALFALEALIALKIIAGFANLTSGILGVVNSLKAIPGAAAGARSSILLLTGVVTGPLLALSGVISGIALGFSDMGRGFFKDHPILKALASTINPGLALGLGSEGAEKQIGGQIKRFDENLRPENLNNLQRPRSMSTVGADLGAGLANRGQPGNSTVNKNVTQNIRTEIKVHDEGEMRKFLDQVMGSWLRQAHAATGAGG
ncbi:MAG TPA: hypothetical protein VFW62_11685 [bacterium]|nr:hypothetical protein [bacterium]